MLVALVVLVSQGHQPNYAAQDFAVERTAKVVIVKDLHCIDLIGTGWINC